MVKKNKSKSRSINKNKEPKIVKIENGITYLEPYLGETKPKRIVSLKTRKLLSEKRRALKKQPRSGQTKKVNNFYDQLDKDYIKQTSAKGKFMRNKTKDDEDLEVIINNNSDYDNFSYTNDNDINDEDELCPEEDKLTEKEFLNKRATKKGFRLYIPITKKDKSEIKSWLSKNSSLLKKIDHNSGIHNEYSIQFPSFHEVKMTESLLVSVEQNKSNCIEYSQDLDYYLDLQSEIEHEIEISSYLKTKGYSQLEIFSYLELNRMESLLNEYNTELKQKETILNNYNSFLENIYNFNLKINNRDNNFSLENNMFEISKINQIIRYYFLLKHNKQKLSLINDYIKFISTDYYEIINSKILKEIFNG